MGHLLDFWLHSPLFFNLVDFPLHNLYGKKTHDCYSFQKKISNIFYFISKPHFSNPFTTYMAFLSPNVTAILKFFRFFCSITLTPRRRFLHHIPQHLPYLSDHCDYVAYMLSTAVSLSFPLSFCQTHSHPTQYDHTRKKCHVSGPMQRHVSTLQKSGVIEMWE